MPDEAAVDTAVATFVRESERVPSAERALRDVHRARREALLELQEAHGLSLQQIAARVGLSRPGVQAILRERDPATLLDDAIGVLCAGDALTADIAGQVLPALRVNDLQVKARRVHMAMKNVVPGWEHTADPDEKRTVMWAAHTASRILNPDAT